MIINIIKFKPVILMHIKTFDGTAEHWDGTCAKRTALRGAIRKHYLKQQEYHCAYCNRLRQDLHGYNWDIDHIIPKSTHPHYTYEPKNFAMSCKECNIKKDDNNVLTTGVDSTGDYPFNKDDYIIIHPHLDEYTENMSVNYNHKHQIYHTPITPKGVETFALCDLNRFTEQIAETSEYISERDVIIGFSDEKFNKFYDGFQVYTSSYVSDPDLKKKMFARYLAEEAGIDFEAVLAAAEQLCNNPDSPYQTDVGNLSVANILPSSEQDED
ncbi:HNH endonuclease [Raoultella ornithinolytica]|uniref:HNH endonuclease n=1 Tax=Raoultella ornithinolytica TaxID=54291 RepID=UPI000B4C72D8|nr:HNH endonuclease [Raoultella ornithinolytica]OWP39782.1 HNH endonuclease [Raoultella ornithinolytica]HDT6598792.1 HNH endonuclease [Raoultella ornithinolytica]